ncbi:MAG: hypothetical protein M1469_01205 [Bacteroidetes bacterium]|nr:hypothetical protein [Bacteroidota bacterium]
MDNRFPPLFDTSRFRTDVKGKRPVSKALIAAVIVALACFIYVVNGLISNGTLNWYVNDRASLNSGGGAVREGDMVTISVPSQKFTFMATTLDKEEELVGHIVAKEATEVTGMILRGDAFTVPSGTAARVLEQRGDYYHVEIVGGDQGGMDGYIPKGFVKK